ncbi:MAG TPA: YciI family protein [Burkholderiales bacterium]|jgi:hypothetical protein|nr:YciI family protein [Burkholderiales bacterium]
MSENVSAAEIIKVSKEHGYLARQLYAVFSTPANGMGPVMQNLEPHLAHQVAMQESGAMFAAGPFWTADEKEWEGEGMFILRASSMAHATELAAADPMHKAGARTFRVRPWLVNEGSITLKMSFSTGKAELI